MTAELPNKKAMRRKTNSAPARFSSREDVWKEISDWAKPTGSGTNNAIGSQLKDNVTEQRLLESRLMDLSKERYKFIVQVAWQRKAFVDKQKTKAGQMKELLVGIEAAQVQTNKENVSNQLNAKNKEYSAVRLKEYADRRKRGNSAKNFLEQMKPICIEPVFRTQSSFSSHQPAGRKYGLDSKQTVFPNIVSASRQANQRAESFSPRLQSRHSVPADMGSRVAASRTTAGNRPTCFSAGTLPRYLQFRSVYDRRFSNLQRSLCNTYLNVDDVKPTPLLLSELTRGTTPSNAPTSSNAPT